MYNYTFLYEGRNIVKASKKRAKKEELRKKLKNNSVYRKGVELKQGIKRVYRSVSDGITRKKDPDPSHEKSYNRFQNKMDRDPIFRATYKTKKTLTNPETYKKAGKYAGYAAAGTAGAAAIGYGAKKGFDKIKDVYKSHKDKKDYESKHPVSTSIKKTSDSLSKKFKQLPNGKKVAVAAIPAAVLAGGAAAIYAWWKKKHQKKDDD